MTYLLPTTKSAFEQFQWSFKYYYNHEKKNWIIQQRNVGKRLITGQNPQNKG